MEALDKRIARLEAARKRQTQCGFFGLVIPPPMSPEEWCKAAAKQQAELIQACKDDAHQAPLAAKQRENRGRN